MPALTQIRPPAVDPQIMTALHNTVEDLAKTLGTEISAVIAQELKHRAAPKTIEKKVVDAMPRLVEQAFIAGFLKDGSSEPRAMLLHLLSTASLRSFSGSAGQRTSASSVGPATEIGEEITSEAAAKLLHVSRTHLNTLVDSGQLGEVHRTAGGHRRISKAAVLRYKASSKERQAKGLDAMVAATERLGLYDEELIGVPVRSKR